MEDACEIHLMRSIKRHSLRESLRDNVHGMTIPTGPTPRSCRRFDRAIGDISTANV